MNTRGMLTFLGTLLVCFATAYVDFHVTEETSTLLVALTGAFAAGFAYGRLGWFWALMIAASLTGAHWIAPQFGVLPRDGGHIGNPLSLMILALPAGVSAYSGAGLRRFAAPKQA